MDVAEFLFFTLLISGVLRLIYLYLSCLDLHSMISRVLCSLICISSIEMGCAFLRFMSFLCFFGSYMLKY